MAVIALLAVTFATMPVPLAINVAFATVCLFAIGRSRVLFEPVGCISCFFGLLIALAALEAWLLGPRKPGDHTLLFMSGCSMIVGLLGAALLRRPDSKVDDRALHRDETELEVERVEHLLRCAHDDGDEIVATKLAEYQRTLKHKAQL
jgi:hypothetical protein